MGFILDRKETEEQIVIRYKRYPCITFLTYGLILFGILGLTFGGVFVLIGGILLCIFLILAIPCWGTHAELKRAMKKGGVKIMGSKYSFSNPLTVVITKSRKDEQEQ